MEGLDSSNCGCSPPDVQDAAGPAQVVEFVNLAGEVFNATTGAYDTSYSLSTFFGTGSDFLSDPRILYDGDSGRWFASILDVGSTAGTMLAASASSDALGGWTVYRIPTPTGYFGDQPILGLSSDLLGIGTTLYSLSNGAFGGGMYWVVNKSGAMAGGTLHYQGFGPDFSAASYHPVDAVSPSGPLYMVTTYGGSTNAISLFNITGVPPAQVTVLETNLSVSAITPAPSGRQPGTSVGIDTGDARVQAALWSNGTLWVGFNDACQASGGSSSRACFRLVEIDTSTGSVNQDFDEGIANTDLYYPAFAVDASGDLTIVFGMSSGTLYPSIEVTGRLSSDPSGTLQQPAPLIDGSTSMSCGGSPVCRYGDYFGASPSVGASGTWVAGEYTGTIASWQTHLGHVELFKVTPQLSVYPIRIDAGQTVVVNLSLANSPCHAGAGGLYCTVSLPLGPGSTYTLACNDQFSGVNLTQGLSQSGLVYLGRGGYVDTYSASNCSAGSLDYTLPLSPVVVTVAPDPTASIAISPAPEVEVGEQVTFQATLAGGTAPYQILWSSLPAGCVSANTLQITCVPSTIGAGTVGVNVTDAEGMVATAGAAVSVGAAPSVTVNLLPGELELGQSVAVVAAVQGGIGTITFDWTSLPAGCPTENASFVTCQPSATGTYPISVTVRDSVGLSSTDSLRSLTVVAPPTLTVSPPSTSFPEGARASWTATLHGGAGPFTYRWTGLPAGCASTNASTLACTPTAAGTFNLTVIVTDALGGNASAHATITVGAPSSLGIAFTVGVIVVSALVVAILAAFLLARRRRLRRLREPDRAPGPR